MASPRWKVYDGRSQYQASVKEPEAAAALLAFYGDGAKLCDGHGGPTIWIEGEPVAEAARFAAAPAVFGRAGESYDAVAAACARYEAERVARLRGELADLGHRMAAAPTRSRTVRHHYAGRPATLTTCGLPIDAEGTGALDLRTNPTLASCDDCRAILRARAAKERAEERAFRKRDETARARAERTIAEQAGPPATAREAFGATAAPPLVHRDDGEHHTACGLLIGSAGVPFARVTILADRVTCPECETRRGALGAVHYAGDGLTTACGQRTTEPNGITLCRWTRDAAGVSCIECLDRLDPHAW